MKAYITSIGEKTTPVSYFALQRLGFEPFLIKDAKTSLWDKLDYIFKNETEDFLRVDGDVVVNQNVLELVQQDEHLWYQGMCFDWFKQDLTHGGVQFIRKDAIPIVRKHISEARHQERPETYLSRLEEFHNPRTFATFEKVCGLHGYKQNDKKRVEDTKMRRGTYGDYDWELAYLLEQL